MSDSQNPFGVELPCSKKKKKAPASSTPKPKSSSTTPKPSKEVAAAKLKQEAAEVSKERARLKEQAKYIKKKEKILNHEQTIMDEDEVNELTNTEVDALDETSNIAWRPNSPIQEAFLSSTEFEVLYAGGRGSGKSDALFVDPLRYVHVAGFRGLLIRRTMPELAELIERAKALYSTLCPGVKWREQDKKFVFPSGAQIFFGYCMTKDDLLRYQGQQYHWLGIDELTQYPEEYFLERLIASVRNAPEGVIPSVRASTNPSGPGVQWVKKRYVGLGNPGDRIEVKTEVPNPLTGGMDIRITTRKWFQSTAYDNPDLMENDPEYVARLAQSSEAMRQQWLFGSWESAEGRAFPEFNRATHVVEPFKIPSGWQKFRAADWGFKSKAVCLWLAINPTTEQVIVYREYVAVETNAKDFAWEVKAREKKERIEYGVLDVSTWGQRDSISSTADIMIAEGCDWIPSERGSKNSRASRKIMLHEKLAKDRDTGGAGILIFSTCEDLINVLETIQIDEKNNEDVDTKGDDHSYDALMYGICTIPADAAGIRHMVQSVRPPVVVDKFVGY